MAVVCFAKGGFFLCNSFVLANINRIIYKVGWSKEIADKCYRQPTASITNGIALTNHKHIKETK